MNDPQHPDIVRNFFKICLALKVLWKRLLLLQQPLLEEGEFLLYEYLDLSHVLLGLVYVVNFLDLGVLSLAQF